MNQSLVGKLTMINTDGLRDYHDKIETFLRTHGMTVANAEEYAVVLNYDRPLDVLIYRNNEKIATVEVSLSPTQWATVITPVEPEPVIHRAPFGNFYGAAEVMAKGDKHFMRVAGPDGDGWTPISRKLYDAFVTEFT